MRKPKHRTKGDIFRPVVQVRKAKNGTPTKIEFNGHAYALIHPDQFTGAKAK